MRERLCERELKGGRNDGRGKGEMRCERRDKGSKRDVRARKRVRQRLEARCAG